MNFRNAFGYLLGFVLFILLIPGLMVYSAGSVQPEPVGIACLIVFSAVGIGLSIWSIIYMKRVGKGNPMDAFNHAVAPRTCELMTDGPYKICRNPMLLGILLYYTGILLFLHSWKPVVIFAVFFLIMMFQVSKEERRLEDDFGDAYTEYKKTTKKIIPFIF